MMQRGEFKAIQMEISVKIITEMFYIHVSLNSKQPHWTNISIEAPPSSNR